MPKPSLRPFSFLHRFIYFLIELSALDTNAVSLQNQMIQNILSLFLFLSVSEGNVHTPEHVYTHTLTVHMRLH